MNIPTHMRFVIALGLQAAVIFAIIIYKAAILSGGTPVLLKLEPVDPRDLFRGDYMTIQYEISQLPQPVQDVRNGDAVYVSLEPRGQFMGIAAYSPVRTTPPATGLFIRGRVVSGGASFGAPDLRGTGGVLRIAYGIEDYFIPEGTGIGTDIWASRHEIPPYAKVRLADDGSAVLEQLYFGGEPWPPTGELKAAPAGAVPPPASEMGAESSFIPEVSDPDGQSVRITNPSPSSRIAAGVILPIEWEGPPGAYDVALVEFPPGAFAPAIIPLAQSVTQNFFYWLIRNGDLASSYRIRVEHPATGQFAETELFSITNPSAAQ